MEFEWEEEKAESNRRKHGAPFAEASTAFADPLAALFPDPDHSGGELREILVGYTDSGRLVVVSYTERGDAVRIISARPTSVGERRHEQRS